MTTEHIPHDGTSRGPLDGLVVADFSRVLAGPLVTMTLADLGAEVIKVERPGAGDDTRSWGPPYSKTGATYFESVNRNKRSVTLDLRDADDLALARELAHRADVVVENFKTGGLARYGLATNRSAPRTRASSTAPSRGSAPRAARNFPDTTSSCRPSVASCTSRASRTATR